MNTPLKLAGFGLGLIAVFGATTGIGAAVGPVVGELPAAEHDMTSDPDAPAGHDDDAHGDPAT